jgi:aminopeptidase N
MERASGRRLGWFFGQWLRQPGYPQLDVAWRADSAARSVTIEVLQTEPVSWGRFAIPAVPVEFRRAGRIVGRRTFELLPQTNSQLVTFGLDEMPDEVVIDPEHTLLMGAVVRN